MPLLTAVYARSPKFGGAVIANIDTINRWSHCALDTGTGTVIEARMLDGVVETPWRDFADRYAGQLVMVGHECQRPEAGIAWARGQLGKPYDWLADLGFAFHRKSWQDEGRWECAELVEAALIQAGRNRFREAPHRITPNMSWMTV